VHPDLGEGAGIEEPVDPLAHRQLAGGVLLVDGRLAAHLLGALAPGGQVVGVLLHPHP